MPHVTRLVTVADLRETADPMETSVSARLDAVLDDGRTLVALAGRGWTAALRGPGARDVSDAWKTATAEEVMETARMVVGPDEPFGEYTQADMEADHWNAIAETLRGAGVTADADELRRLPHDVTLTGRLRARLEGPG